MTVKFVARIPTAARYGYLEVYAEGQPGQPEDSVRGEFVVAVSFAEDYAKTLKDAVEVPGATEAAVHNLQQQGVVPQGQSVQQLPQVAGPPPWAAPTQQAQQQFAPPNAQPPAGWQASVPQQQQAVQQGPLCKHGPREYVAKANWKAWMCPSPKGTPDKCDPEWVK